MTHGFDRDYWESYWQRSAGRRPGPDMAPNPYLASATVGLVPGTALDAGCGEGAEARWLAAQGWRVTAVDISAEALARSRRAFRRECRERPGDVGRGRPDCVGAGPAAALVTTHYAHPAMPQLAFYERLSSWVAPGGTLLIVGHLHDSDSHDSDSHDPDSHDPDSHDPDSTAHGHGYPPEEASVTAASVTARLDAAEWTVVIADEHVRTLADETGQTGTLHDVVVRATRA